MDVVINGEQRKVTPGATLLGYPARPRREYLRAQAAMYRLAKIVDELEDLVKPASNNPDH